ncbi:hypothetical protein TrRE_jg11569, partial [Triparma retinervis]
CIDFNTKASEVWDLRFALAATALVVWSIGYQVVYQSWKISKKSGWTRPWPLGPTLFNKRMHVFDQGYRLWTDEIWGEKHGKKFIGEGVPEPGPTYLTSRALRPYQPFPLPFSSLPQLHFFLAASTQSTELLIAIALNRSPKLMASVWKIFCAGPKYTMTIWASALAPMLRVKAGLEKGSISQNALVADLQV